VTLRSDRWGEGKECEGDGKLFSYPTEAYPSHSSARRKEGPKYIAGTSTAHCSSVRSIHLRSRRKSEQRIYYLNALQGNFSVFRDFTELALQRVAMILAHLDLRRIGLLV
jgi:hypothetical protein